MIFTPMKPAEIEQALEGQEDIITPALESHRKYFSQLHCFNCGGQVMPVVDHRCLFKPGEILPSYLAECTVCHCQFEPYTKIEVQMPKEAEGLATGQPEFPLSEP